MADHITEAEALTARPQELYAVYAQSLQAEKPSFSRLFRHWLSYDPGKIDAASQALLDGVRGTTAQLVSLLETCEAPAPAALAAVRLLLEQDESAPTPAAALLFQAAAPECAPLLRFLTAEQLGIVRRRFLAKTPRSRMLPRERELLEQMDALLKESSS